MLRIKTHFIEADIGRYCWLAWCGYLGRGGGPIAIGMRCVTQDHELSAAYWRAGDANGHNLGVTMIAYYTGLSWSTLPGLGRPGRH